MVLQIANRLFAMVGTAISRRSGDIALNADEALRYHVTRLLFGRWRVAVMLVHEEFLEFAESLVQIFQQIFRRFFSKPLLG